ncbi:MAG: hypothetical protein ACOYJO_01770 [Eubacterium sp.]|jgi:uncharacterized protein (DUF885 family)
MKRNYDKYKQNFFSPFGSNYEPYTEAEDEEIPLDEEADYDDFLEELPDYAAMSVQEMEKYRDELKDKLDAEQARHDELEKRYAEARKVERESYLQKKSQGTMHTSGILLEITCFALGLGIGQLIIWAIRG